MTALLVGVDGGGSKTHVLVADAQGAPLNRLDGPGSAVRGVEGAAAAADTIAEIVRDAIAGAGVEEPVVKALCVGVAGVGREGERAALINALTELGIAEEVVVETDAAIALEDAFGEHSGVLLVAGTGSIAFGRSPTGTEARAGGWGPVFGDEGGGAWLGRRALSVVTAAADGREPETALTGAILTAAQVNDVSELIAWAQKATPSDFAALAPVVIHVADQGDLRANALCTMAVEELVLHVRALARQLFVDERAAFAVALAGGLLKKKGGLRKRLEHRLKSAGPGANVRPEEIDAARGAVKHALRFLGAGAA